ncbi:hypothetical protein Tco_0240650 [Tanacetum coccineum]
MIAYSISGRGQAPKKVIGVDLFYLRNMDRGTSNVLHLLAHYLFRHAEGRKSGARLSGGHFIRRLAMHFGLLGRLNICTRYGDTWAWVAQGPERQQAAAASAHEADEARPAAEEVALEIPVPAPAQAPPPTPPAPQPLTMSSRIERLEEEVHDLWRDVVGLRGDVASFTIEQSRVSTWLISCMTQLMDASGQTYQPFDSTLVGCVYAAKCKEKGEDVPEWTIRSRFEDELANFMHEKKSHTKGIGEMLDQHRKELHEQFSQILSTIRKSDTPKPEAPTFAITTRSGVST